MNETESDKLGAGFTLSRDPPMQFRITVAYERVFMSTVDPSGHQELCWLIDNVPMVRITPEGFWVRGEQVPQGPGEAQRVYGAMVQWLERANAPREVKV